MKLNIGLGRRGKWGMVGGRWGNQAVIDPLCMASVGLPNWGGYGRGDKGWGDGGNQAAMDTLCIAKGKTGEGGRGGVVLSGSYAPFSFHNLTGVTTSIPSLL